MIQSRALFNPFPGLRPFEPDEDHLFFGREREIDELLRRLRTTRFLQVIGSSGSGKSSLVRSGLIPALYSGFMAKAGSSWRVLIFRPGDDPIGNLAASLNAPDALGTEGELASTNKILLEATLRRSTLGLVDAVRQARIPSHDNLLVVVDQFEELFRFRRSTHSENSRDESVAFFKLLLEAAAQEQLPIYVVLTMRSDFIGDCMEFQGLPEAVNTGLYLVPRMTRDELRSAITGPVAVGGGDIAQRLVLRLLNDLGDDHDQLPVLQHALMRTWDHWEAHRQDGQPIDIADYEAVGTLQNALSLHAEEAFQDTSFESGHRIAEKMFQALTDTFSDPRGIRRPTSVAELSAICESPESEVLEVVEVFRRSGRSFLTPHAGVSLGPRSIIDISHESLMRCWTRLIGWAEEERESARTYIRVSQAASWCIECSGGLWTDPQLETGLQWRRKNSPTAAWAERYDSNFVDAMKFLDDSEHARQVGRDKERRRKRNRTIIIYVLAAFSIIVLGEAYFVRREGNRAKQNLVLARSAVEESLATIGAGRMGETGEGAYTPETEEIRKEILNKAKEFYLNFAKQGASKEEYLSEQAFGRSKLGDINRQLALHEEAVRDYSDAISDYGALAQSHPDKPLYREMQAYSYDGLGETFRTWLLSPQKPAAYTSADAEHEYNAALTLQQALTSQYPGNASFQDELARTYNNRGILYFYNRDLDKSEADFRLAVRLLEPLVLDKNNIAAAQDLGRTYNNLGILLLNRKDPEQAGQLLVRAIGAYEPLTAQDPANREYKQEVANFYNNLALAYSDQKRFDLAERNNHEALDRFEQLAQPGASLEGQRARAHTLHDWIARRQTPDGAESQAHPEFHVMYANLARSFAQIARESLRVDNLSDALSAVESMHRLLPRLSKSEQLEISGIYASLRKELDDKLAQHK